MDKVIADIKKSGKNGYFMELISLSSIPIIEAVKAKTYLDGSLLPAECLGPQILEHIVEYTANNILPNTVYNIRNDYTYVRLTGYI